MTILYSAKSTIDKDGQLAYRITKFTDGEVESSYLTDGHQCDCPAGVRPSCRHRQMLPQMIADDIINTHWFLEWDNKGGVVDFDGVPKAVYDLALATPAFETSLAGEALQGSPINDLFNLPNYHGVTIREVESVTPATTESAPQTQDTDHIDWDILAEERLGQRPIEHGHHIPQTSPVPGYDSGSITKPWRRF